MTRKPASDKAKRTLADLPELLASLPHLTPNEADAYAADIAAARAELAAVERRAGGVADGLG